MKPKAQKFEDLPRAQQGNLLKYLLPFPALSVMVIMRRDIGYRLVALRHLMPLTLFMLITSILFQIFTEPGSKHIEPKPLLIFALVSFSFGIYQRIRRWWDFNRGVRHFSFYLGTSPFAFRWLPMFLQRNRRVARFIDPLFCSCMGVFVLFFSLPLGFWLISAGAGLRLWEDEVYQKELNRDLDMVDGLIIADVQNQVVQHFESTSRAGQQGTGSAVPTGLGDDVHEKIKRRKAKQSPPQKGV